MIRTGGLTNPLPLIDRRLAGAPKCPGGFIAGWGSGGRRPVGRPGAPSGSFCHLPCCGFGGAMREGSGSGPSLAVAQPIQHAAGSAAHEGRAVARAAPSLGSTRRDAVTLGKLGFGQVIGRKGWLRFRFGHKDPFTGLAGWEVDVRPIGVCQSDKRAYQYPSAERRGFDQEPWPLPVFQTGGGFLCQRQIGPPRGIAARPAGRMPPEPPKAAGRTRNSAATTDCYQRRAADPSAVTLFQAKNCNQVLWQDILPHQQLEQRCNPLISWPKFGLRPNFAII